MGDAGIYQTLREMTRFVNESFLSPAIRRRAFEIIRGCPGIAFGCQVEALRAWLLVSWRFVRDPAGVELVHRPERLLDEFRQWGYITGDCDDAAVLGAALGKAVGFPARWVVLGFHGPRSPFTHVFVELMEHPGQWKELDVTRPPRRPPTTRRKVIRV